MYALIQCQRVSNPSTTMVDVESVQFADDFEPSEFTAPSVGKIGTAVLELEPTVQADAILIEKLSNNPKWFRVVMKTGATGGWYYGYGDIDRNRMTIPEITTAFDRKLSVIDTSKGEPSLLRSKEITFFKNV